MRPRRQYHIHSTLLIYAFVALLIAVGAFTSQNNLLFWCFGMAIGMMLASGAISGYMMMRVRVERQPVADGQAGKPIRTRYAVTNTSRWFPLFALAIAEQPPDSDAASQGSEARARFDHAPEAFVVHVPPRTTLLIEAPALAVSRGRLRLGRFSVTTTFPFGIVRKSLVFEQPGSSLVLPARISSGPSDRAASSGRQHVEDAHSRVLSHGREYAGLREYRDGDNPRLIAWRPSARLTTNPATSVPFLVRQTYATSPGRLHIILDLPADAPGDPRERAISAAAGVIDAASQQGLLVSLTVPVHGIHSSLRAGRVHAESLLGQLSLLPESPQAEHLGSRIPTMRMNIREPFVVVHAGPEDRTIGPQWAARITAADLRDDRSTSGEAA